MTRLNSRAFARNNCALLGSALLALGAAAGCAGGAYAEPANVEGQVVVVGPPQDEGSVVYVEEAPVVDIETYPTVVYGGVNVYYVEGRWYQRGPRGWGYYREEPRELGRQREERSGRDHDPRWGNQRGPEQRAPQERAAVPEQRAPQERTVAPEQRGEQQRAEEQRGEQQRAGEQRGEQQRAAAPEQRPGVAERHAPDHSAPAAPAAQPRREEARAPIAPKPKRAPTPASRPAEQHR